MFGPSLGTSIGLFHNEVAGIGLKQGLLKVQRSPAQLETPHANLDVLSVVKILNSSTGNQIIGKKFGTPAATSVPTTM